MKKLRLYSYLFAFALTLWSCGGGGGDDPDPPTPPVNNAPSTPTLTAPTNALLCTDNTVQFQWSSSTDPDGDAVSYQLQIATDNQFSQNLQTSSMSTSSTTITLNRGVAYYWRVRATDSKSASSPYSATFSFYTEGDGVSNHLPFLPELKNPTQDATVTTASVTLEWEPASDVDGDSLTYDVYLDSNNPPTTQIGDNLSGTTLDENLNASTNYYWRVVVKDGKGETVGQVWRFKTD